MDARARLTPVDVVFFGVALLVLGFMAKPMYQTMQDNASAMSTGTAYLFQMLFPSIAITIIAVIYLTAISGGASS